MAREADEDDDKDELESSLASASASDGAAMLGAAMPGAAMLAVSSSYFMSSIVTAPFFVPWTSCRHEAMVALQVVGVRLQLSHCPESLGLTWTCRAWSCMLKSTQHATKRSRCDNGRFKAIDLCASTNKNF